MQWKIVQIILLERLVFFAKYYDPFTGHYTFVIGRCSSETVQIGTGNNFVTNYYCV